MLVSPRIEKSHEEMVGKHLVPGSALMALPRLPISLQRRLKQTEGFALTFSRRHGRGSAAVAAAKLSRCVRGCVSPPRSSSEAGRRGVAAHTAKSSAVEPAANGLLPSASRSDPPHKAGPPPWQPGAAPRPRRRGTHECPGQRRRKTF
eukprot:GHVT01086204.1.p1 GENE.GHVT01086204.1~~GHVT01086204.1.p1  ORF type:complete len:148 (+),score=28.82 GHVT01086204.1:139-582(+)